VRAAEQEDERAALERRYEAAHVTAGTQGAGLVLQAFETAVEQSTAVVCRYLSEVQRLASGDDQIYAPYYALIRAGVRLPKGEKWDVLRAVTDESLFAGYKEQIRFAALTVDGVGLTNYGDCSLIARTDMIAHRSSVFEENTVLWAIRHKVKIAEAINLPRGYRAPWNGRAKLSVAKLAGEFRSDTPRNAFPNLLLKPGEKSEDDQFIEVHIWGPMTARTFERVLLRRQTTRQAGRVIIKALREKLSQAGVSLEVQ
jgi:hypothetical protein